MSRPSSTLEALSLSENTDVCLWCPTPGDEDLLVAGTYQLLPESGTRIGSLHAWRFSRKSERGAEGLAGAPSDASRRSGAAEAPRGHLEPLPSLSLPCGVFEACWAPPGSSRASHLAAALTDGTVRVYGVPGTRGPVRRAEGEADAWKELYASTPLGSDASVLACCVDWCRHDPDRLVASTSEGGLAVLRFAEGGASKKEGPAPSLSGASPSSFSHALSVVCSTRCAHSLEAWAASCGFSAHDLWSGGDDVALFRWDDRAGLDAPVARNSRVFSAGVTCIAPHPVVEHLLAVGSYDERVRIFDARSLRTPLAEGWADGGGVWRARWKAGAAASGDASAREAAGGMASADASRETWWLALACMQAGQAIAGVEVAWEGSEGRGEGAGARRDVSVGDLAYYPRQKSLAYGIDWKRETRAEIAEGRRVGLRGSVLASCSFYDNSLDVWEL